MDRSDHYLLSSINLSTIDNTLIDRISITVLIVLNREIFLNLFNLLIFIVSYFKMKKSWIVGSDYLRRILSRQI